MSSAAQTLTKEKGGAIELALLQDLRDLFKFRKTTMNSDAAKIEQDTLFVVLTDPPRVRPSAGGKMYARVRGDLVVYSENERNTLGTISRLLEQAPAALKSKFFFYDIERNIENSPAREVNISERRTSFVYFYSGQYDPNQGTLNELELTLECT